MRRSRSGPTGNRRKRIGAAAPPEGAATTAPESARVPLSPDSLPPELLSAAHQVAGMGMFVTNLRTRRVRASRELATLFRLPNEPVEMTLDEYRQRFYHPDDREHVAERTDRAIATGESRLGEMHVRRADGTEMWVRVSALRQFSASGDPVLVGLMQDITETHAAQEALRASEGRLRTLIEKAPTAIVVIRGGVTLYVNEKCRRLFGVTGDDAGTGVRIEDFWAPESRSRVAELVRDRAEGLKLPAILDGVALRLDGTRFPVHVEMEAVDLPDGPATLAFVTDVTAQRQVESRVAYLNRLYAMLSATNEMIVRVTDERQLLQRACDIAVEMGGFRMAWIGVLQADSTVVRPVASAGIVGGYLDSVRIDMADPARSAGPSGRAMRSGEHQFCNDIATDPVMAPWREAALALGYRSSAAFPLRADGAVVGLLTLYSATAGSFDPNELRVLDDLAADIGFAIELARRNAERHSLEDQLRQAQKMEAVGRLAGGVAHDFNNILAAILMQTELASEDDTAPQVREVLADIRESAQRAAALTRQLLAFSRRQVMQPRELDLNEAVASLVKMLGRMVGEDVEVQVRLHPEPLLTRADAGMLDQVLMNLAVNARDAMPHGGRLILRTAQAVIDDRAVAELRALPHGRYVSLSVTDTGTGIAPDVMPHIFEPFFTTKESGKGTGLGLATVFGIVKQHGGAVLATSTASEGTTFQVVLPAAAASAVESDGEAPRPAKGGTETILVVEDDAAIRRILARVLERAGYRVLQAANAVDGVRAWDESGRAVQLLVTDLVMPGGLGGRELAERLRADVPTLRVLFSTGYSADIGGRDFALLDGQNFIQKPFEGAKFLEVVRCCLDQ